MKLRHQLVATALLLTASVSGMASKSVEEKRDRLRMLRTEASRKLKLSPLDQAYMDTFTILGQANTCSEFFGGHAAQEVLEALVIQLREERMNNATIGIRMSGAFTLYAGSDGNSSYRLFAHAELNTEGPFRRAKVFTADPFVPRVGSFPPNTREARLLILLHELAHLVKARTGGWLIPDDGNIPALSRQNTAVIETQCRREILSIGEKDNKVVWY